MRTISKNIPHLSSHFFKRFSTVKFESKMTAPIKAPKSRAMYSLASTNKLFDLLIRNSEEESKTLENMENEFKKYFPNFNKSSLSLPQVLSTLHQIAYTTLVDSWNEQLNAVKLLLKSNKVSEADKKCNILIEMLESQTSDVELKESVAPLLCETYVLKANMLSRGSYEDEYQQALSLYEKALQLIPDYTPAKEGRENLLTVRGESNQMKVKEIDSQSSPFNYSP